MQLRMMPLEGRRKRIRRSKETAKFWAWRWNAAPPAGCMRLTPVITVDYHRDCCAFAGLHHGRIMNANVSVLGKLFSVTTLALLAFGCSNKDEKTPSGGVGELLQPSPSDGQSPLDAAYQRACDKVFECASVSEKESLGRDMICVGTGIVRGRGKLQGGECEKASIALLECYASQSCDALSETPTLCAAENEAHSTACE